MYAQDRKYLNFKYFVKDSGSEGQRLTEAQAINKSLSNLGNVIMALAQKVTFLSYFQNVLCGDRTIHKNYSSSLHIPLSTNMRNTDIMKKILLQLCNFLMKPKLIILELARALPQLKVDALAAEQPGR